FDRLDLGLHARVVPQLSGRVLDLLVAFFASTGAEHVADGQTCQDENLSTHGVSIPLGVVLCRLSVVREPPADVWQTPRESRSSSLPSIDELEDVAADGTHRVE